MNQVIHDELVPPGVTLLDGELPDDLFATLAAASLASGTAPEHSAAGSQWQASLALRFRQTARGCRLIASRHQGPLYVQRPFYPEGPELAHVYLLHPPGGLVSGDCLKTELQLEAGSQVLCTTPGAGRAYRARADQRLQEQHYALKLAPGASLEWFPQEMLMFPGAHASLQTTVDLEAGARFCGWEITVLGLPANGIEFSSGRLRQRLVVRVAGRPALLEQLVLDAAQPALYRAAAGLRAQPVNGIFVCGPFDAAQCAALDLAALQASSVALPSLCGITRVGAFVVGRFLGTCAQEARRCFLAWWTVLRPLLLQRPACLPAIWLT